MKRIADLKKRIETIIKSGEGKVNFPLSSFLSTSSIFYGGAVKLRSVFYSKGIICSKRLPCMVISVGNITLGGTGKTPMTIYTAQLIRRLGYKVVVISRGYKGGAEKIGGIVSNGSQIFMTSDDAGDEPFMMVQKLDQIPVIVGQDRFTSGMLAIREFDPQVVILDDGFQHLKLLRDMDLVLLDYSRPFGNNHLFPRGVLREPISALLRGDAFILTRSDAPGPTAFNDHIPLTQGRPVFRSFHVPRVYKVLKGKTIECDQGLLKRCKVYAFAGIARNDDFQRTLKEFECKIKGFLDFPDHHRYSSSDIDKILRSAKAAEADVLITTEKDHARITNEVIWPMDLMVVGIEVSFGTEANSFFDFIKSKIEEIIASGRWGKGF
jgi:tetraacyldisaccharide 4'-kinase